jgi:hypothetical protein
MPVLRLFSIVKHYNRYDQLEKVNKMHISLETTKPTYLPDRKIIAKLYHNALNMNTIWVHSFLSQTP